MENKQQILEQIADADNVLVLFVKDGVGGSLHFFNEEPTPQTRADKSLEMWIAATTHIENTVKKDEGLSDFALAVFVAVQMTVNNLILDTDEIIEAGNMILSECVGEASAEMLAKLNVVHQ